MKAFALFFLINTIAPALAFGQVATTSDPQPTKNYGVDCSIVASSPGCKSYNELLASKDEEIWRLMKAQNALVCFREAEDVFTIVSFDFPPESLYKKDPKSPLFLSAGSAVFFGRFSSGFSEGVKYISGNWIRRPRGTSADASFLTDKNYPVQLNIDGSEVSIAYSYTNLAKTMTDYSIQIRRSTLRSIETWTFPDDSPKKPDIRTTQSGHCVAYSN